MNIKYSKKKEELRKDPVLESIEKSRIFIKEKGNRIITSIVIIVIIFIGFQIVTYVKETSLSKAQDDFGRAMIVYTEGDVTKAIEAFNLVIENHKKTPHAAYSAYMIGYISLLKENYDGAIDYFEKVLSNKKDIGFIQGQSLEGLATCYEAKGDLNKSLHYFEKAINNKTVAYRYPTIKWKMALINKKLGNDDKVFHYCNEIISDTLAMDLKKKAENLLATM